MKRKLLIYCIYLVAISYGLANVVCIPSGIAGIQYVLQLDRNRSYLVDLSYVAEYSTGFPFEWIRWTRISPERLDMPRLPVIHEGDEEMTRVTVRHDGGEETFRWEIYWAFLGLNCAFLVAVAAVMYCGLKRHVQAIQFSIVDAFCFLVLAAILWMFYSLAIAFFSLVAATSIVAFVLLLMVYRFVERLSSRDSLSGQS